MKSWERVLDILKEEMKAQLREELLEEFKSIARGILIGDSGDISRIEKKEYMHMNELLAEHKIGRSMFFKIREQNYFDGQRQGRFMVYHVAQFLEAKRKYRGKKPDFNKGT